jgi:cystathionine beta-synthase/cysteine synthase A
VTRARLLHGQITGAFLLNQYDNPQNPEAHYLGTGPEIWRQMKGEVDIFAAAGSTGGTLSGAGRFLKQERPDIDIVLFDPIGSVYHSYFREGRIDPASIAPYRVEGVGKDYLAGCMDFGVIDEVMQFDDEAAFNTCRELARREGLLCGGSSGANVWGCLQLAKRLGRPANIVTVLPDGGGKYLSKIYR